MSTIRVIGGDIRILEYSFYGSFFNRSPSRGFALDVVALLHMPFHLYMHTYIDTDVYIRLEGALQSRRNLWGP